VGVVASRSMQDAHGPSSMPRLRSITQAADALKKLHTRQARQKLIAGRAWRDHGLVSCTRNGTPLSAGYVRRAFRAITKAAGIGEDWAPRELRHSFVSIMSDSGRHSPPSRPRSSQSSGVRLGIGAQRRYRLGHLRRGR
jgi:site-specific recombinase XerD